jgi:peptidoglycan/LPS O-acetylase OafA/YrhL
MGALRLFLALVVATDHLELGVVKPQLGVAIDTWLKLGVNAGFAVMWFYVISGFLMSMVLAEKYSASFAGTRAFYSARAIRIFCLYWPLLLIVLVLEANTRDMFFALPWPEKLANVFLIGADTMVAFAHYPNFHFNLLSIGQAWTLGAELTFYVLAPFGLRSWKLAAGLLIGSLATRAACIVAVGGFDAHWMYLFFPATLCFFLLGHFARCAGARWRLVRHPATGGALLVLAFGCLLYGGPALWDSVCFWIATLCFAAALPGVFEATRSLRTLNALGDLSYPVYLTHIVAIHWLIGLVPIEILTKNLGGSVNAVAAVIALWLVAIAAATHWLIERPVGTMMCSIAALKSGRRREALQTSPKPLSATAPQILR